MSLRSLGLVNHLPSLSLPLNRPSEKKKFKTEVEYEAYRKSLGKPKYDPAKQGMIIDRNLYSVGEEQGLALYGVPWRPKHEKFVALGGFTAKTGFDANSRVGDPGLTSPEQGDYRPSKEGAAWAMQAGWLLAPASLDEWARAFGLPGQ